MLAERYPRYGFKELFQVIRRQGHEWNYTRVIRVLGRIIASRGYPLKLRMDNEPVFISLTLAQSAEDHGVQLEFIKPSKPTQHAFIERINRTYRTEKFDFYLFRSLNKVREITDRWLREYNS